MQINPNLHKNNTTVVINVMIIIFVLQTIKLSNDIIDYV